MIKSTIYNPGTYTYFCLLAQPSQSQIIRKAVGVDIDDVTFTSENEEDENDAEEGRGRERTGSRC